MDSMFNKRFSTIWVAGRREVLDGFETVIEKGLQQEKGSEHAYAPASPSRRTVGHDRTSSSQQKAISTPSITCSTPIQFEGECPWLSRHPVILRDRNANEQAVPR